MKLKKMYYESSRTLVYSVVLFNNDVTRADQKMLNIAGAKHSSLVDALYALMMIAREAEKADAYRYTEQKDKAA